MNITQRFRIRACSLSALIILAGGCGNFYSEQPDDSTMQLFSDAVWADASESALRVSSFTAPDGTTDPGIEAHLDHTSLLLDFSNVNAPGELVFDAFVGYLVDSDQPDFCIADVLTDEAETTVEPGSLDLMFTETQLVIDLRGLAYDEGTFIKIDIVPCA